MTYFAHLSRRLLRGALLASLLVSTVAAEPVPPTVEAESTDHPPPPAEPACVIDHESAARAVTDAYAKLRRIYREQLPGPRGQEILQQRLEALVDDSIDVEAFVHGILRGFWEYASEAQQHRWRATLDQVLRQRYLKGIKAPGRQQIRVQRSLVSCNQAAVRVLITDRDARSERMVDMDLIHREPSWRVYDVTIDGVSLLGTWRSRFRRIFNEGGVAGVDEQMQLLARRYDLALGPLEPEPEPPLDQP